MSDNILDYPQLINGIAILFSFFVGYKFGTSLTNSSSSSDSTSKAPAKNLPGVGNWMLDSHGKYKMILVVRNDLKMGKGKIAAQCCHAAVGAYEDARIKIPDVLRKWEQTGAAKIAVKVDDETTLKNLKRLAASKNLVTCLIRDAGHTQIAPNTVTVLAIGPGPVDAIERLTGHLKLL